MHGAEPTLGALDLRRCPVEMIVVRVPAHHTSLADATIEGSNKLLEVGRGAAFGRSVEKVSIEQLARSVEGVWLSNTALAVEAEACSTVERRLPYSRKSFEQVARALSRTCEGPRA
jgi:hypothetical protein